MSADSYRSGLSSCLDRLLRFSRDNSKVFVDLQFLQNFFLPLMEDISMMVPSNEKLFGSSDFSISSKIDRFPPTEVKIWSKLSYTKEGELDVNKV
jgi:hypothetical protein